MLVEEEIPLDLQFNAISNSFTKIVVDGNLDDDSEIFSACHAIGICKRALSSKGLYSKNDELEDVSTSTLKYFFLDYFEAKLDSSIRNLKLRKGHLIRADILLRSYLETCRRLELLHEDEVLDIDAEAVRTHKAFFKIPIMTMHATLHTDANFSTRTAESQNIEVSTSKRVSGQAKGALRPEYHTVCITLLSV